jgi:hypothetical protein
MLYFKHIVYLIFMALFLCSGKSFAQKVNSDDSIITTMKPVIHKKNPRTATVLSFALPGSGQVYNGKYWKAPIVWGGLIGLALLAIDQHNMYNLSNKKIATLDTDTSSLFKPKTDPESQSLLIQYSADADYYRRNRDFSWLGFAALYMYQVVDACVDAHLSEFDMSDNISAKISPYIKGNNLYNYHSGISFTMKFNHKN